MVGPSTPTVYALGDRVEALAAYGGNNNGIYPYPSATFTMLTHNEWARAVGCNLQERPQELSVYTLF